MAGVTCHGNRGPQAGGKPLSSGGNLASEWRACVCDQRGTTLNWRPNNYAVYGDRGMLTTLWARPVRLNKHLISMIVGILLCAAGTLQATTIVHVQTVLGDIEIELFDNIAPLSVQNFLNYVNDGDYDGTFIHRSVPGFVIQGGGYIFDPASGTANHIPTDAPVVNEFSLSNVRGTVAMAKLGGDPDSATSEWFINLVDNSADLDNQNGGFTVFGQVINNGMRVADAIAALPRIDVGGAFDTLPVIDYQGGAIGE